MAQTLPRLSSRLIRVQTQEFNSLRAKCVIQQTRSSKGLGTRSYANVGEQPQHPPKQRSRHAAWYSDILPGMIPVALLGFVVYGLLEISRISLMREKQALDHVARIEQLEREIAIEQAKRIASQASSETQTPIEGQKARRWSLW